jgi:hypothetical protein
MQAADLRIQDFLDNFHREVTSPGGQRHTWTFEQLEEMFAPEDWEAYGELMYEDTPDNLIEVGDELIPAPDNWEDYGRIMFAREVLEIGKLRRPEPRSNEPVGDNVILFPVPAGRAPDVVAHQENEASTKRRDEARAAPSYPGSAELEASIDDYFKTRLSEAKTQ